MSETIETITVQIEGVTLSRLLWARFKRPMPGIVERVLSANPRLAALGAVIPVGTAIKVPIPAPRNGNVDITPVRLW